MTDDERTTEPTNDQPAGAAAKGPTRPPKNTGAAKDPDESAEADKTDMSAVGDDGQVFGG